MINRGSVYAAIMILPLGMVWYLMATNERANEACAASPNTGAETCEYILR